MKLFKITMVAVKTFYVEAKDELAALESEVLENEESFNFGKSEWEHDETSAKEVSIDQRKYINPKRILK